MNATNVRFTQCGDSNTLEGEVKPPSQQPIITFNNNRINSLKSIKTGFVIKNGLMAYFLFFHLLPCGFHFIQRRLFQRFSRCRNDLFYLAKTTSELAICRL
ncbi:hypothetical protein PEC106664_16890 [Pectobacterium carotovorum subsp. carotovorum]|nr:hypothetical protein PEC106664_16890 [Pectobacterium carotovorum subsp. carotovorum]